jgi:hypothetical protein
MMCTSKPAKTCCAAPEEVQHLLAPLEALNLLDELKRMVQPTGFCIDY